MLRCPVCNSPDSTVILTQGGYKRRRRCPDGHLYNTEEQVIQGWLITEEEQKSFKQRIARVILEAKGYLKL